MTFQKGKTDRGRRKRTIRGSTCICAFKSPQARAECWESRPVPFSWPLRGGRFASGSMDGDATSEKIQEGTTNISAHPNMHIIAGTDTFPCLSWPTRASLYETAEQPHILSMTSNVDVYCHGTVYLVLRQKHECLCILKNSGDSLNVGQELPLVKSLMLAWTWSLEVKAAFKIFS